MAFEKNAVGKISSKLKIFFAVGKLLSLMERTEAQPLSMLVEQVMLDEVDSGRTVPIKPERSENFLNSESKPFRKMCPRSIFENEIILPK